MAGRHLALALVLLGSVSALPVRAAEWNEALALDPPMWSFDGLDLTLGGSVSGALYSAAQDGGISESGGTGQVRANARLERTLDNGFVLGARTNILALHDDLSGDRYGNDTIQKAYAYVQAGYGTLELGEQDGVGAQMGITGPRVATRVSLDNPDTTFFKNPATGERFDGFFRPFAAVTSSSVDAKINYITPRLFGVQLGGSYTPAQVKAPLPFAGNPSDGANSQDSLLEAAINYSTYVSDVAIGASASLLQSTLTHGTPGHDDLYDWALGLEAAYPVAGVRVSLGGGYRASNAYGFHTNAVFGSGQTHLTHVSLMAQDDPWSIGAEYSNGDANAPAGFSDYTMTGYQVAIGYRVNGNMDVALGWQWYDYDREIGAFYNGAKQVTMNAGFLTLNYGL